MVVRALEATCVSEEQAVWQRVALLIGEPACERQPSPIQGAGPDVQGAHPLGAEEPLLPRYGQEVCAQLADGHRHGTDRLRAIDRQPRTVGVGEVGQPGDRQECPGRPGDMGKGHEPCARQ